MKIKLFCLLIPVASVLGIVAVFMTCAASSDESDAGALFGDDDTAGDDDDTTGEDVENVPAGVNDFMNADDVEALESAGMPIYYGNSPPIVEGG